MYFVAGMWINHCIWYWWNDFPFSALTQLAGLQDKWRGAQRRRKHCVVAVVRRSQKFSPRRRHPSRGRRTTKNFISWRWSLYLYLQTQFGEDQCTQFRVIIVTDPQTDKQTGAITIHCIAASVQCNEKSRLMELNPG